MPQPINSSNASILVHACSSLKFLESHISPSTMTPGFPVFSVTSRRVIGCPKLYRLQLLIE